MDDTFEPPNALMDLGLGPAAPAPAPPAAPPTLQSFLPHPGIAQKIAPFAVLAAALLGGKKMNGLAQGYAQGQHQMGQEDLQRAQLMQQDAYRQSQAQVQQQEFQQRQAQLEEAKRMQALNTIKANVSKITDAKQYDAAIDAYASQMQLAGFRTVTPNQLRVAAPFVAPSAKDIAGSAVTAWLKNPANAAALKKDPSIVSKAVLQIDTNGDGIPENVPLMRAGQLGGIQFAQDEQGNAIALESGDPKIGSAFQEVYKAGLARFIADNKRQPDPKEKQAILGDSIKKAKEDSQPPDEGVVSLSPAGLDAAALNYAKTGTLPAMGMSKASSGVRSKIINRAAELYPGLDVAANKGEFNADAASLNKLTQLRNSVGAFEKTANANLDRFIATAGKVADSGSPLINQPYRAVKRRLIGDQDVAAFEAARIAAQNEIARVLNTANLSGQLTDSARHEMQTALSADATLGQIVATAKILKADMQSRRESYDSQIAELSGRMKNKPGQTPAAPDTGGAWVDVGGGIKVRKKS